MTDIGRTLKPGTESVRPEGLTEAQRDEVRAIVREEVGRMWEPRGWGQGLTMEVDGERKTLHVSRDWVCDVVRSMVCTKEDVLGKRGDGLVTVEQLQNYNAWNMANPSEIWEMIRSEIRDADTKEAKETLGAAKEVFRVDGRSLTHEEAEAIMPMFDWSDRKIREAYERSVPWWDRVTGRVPFHEWSLGAFDFVDGKAVKREDK